MRINLSFHATKRAKLKKNSFSRKDAKQILIEHTMNFLKLMQAPHKFFLIFVFLSEAIVADVSHSNKMHREIVNFMNTSAASSHFNMMENRLSNERLRNLIQNSFEKSWQCRSQKTRTVINEISCKLQQNEVRIKTWP